MATKKSKTRKKVTRELPEKRPSTGWGPDTVKGLRWEQKKLRDLSQTVKDGLDSIPRPGGSRRKVMDVVLSILSYPDRHDIDTDLLAAVDALVSYNDPLACAILNVVADDYERRIEKLKEIIQRKRLGHRT